MNTTGEVCLDGENNGRMASQAQANYQNHATGWRQRGYRSWALGLWYDFHEVECHLGNVGKEVCRKNGISSPTFYKWKAKYGGLGVSELKRLKELESENANLKRMYADMALENAVAESFFQLLKRERIKRHIYSTRNDARADVVDYIDMFYNSRRRHGFNNLLSPVEYERRFTKRLVGV